MQTFRILTKCRMFQNMSTKWPTNIRYFKYYVGNTYYNIINNTAVILIL